MATEIETGKPGQTAEIENEQHRPLTNLPERGGGRDHRTQTQDPHFFLNAFSLFIAAIHRRKCTGQEQPAHVVVQSVYSQEESLIKDITSQGIFQSSQEDDNVH